MKDLEKAMHMNASYEQVYMYMYIKLILWKYFEYSLEVLEILVEWKSTSAYTQNTIYVCFKSWNAIYM